MGKVVLWHFQGSHFCEKARWALDFKRIPHVRRALGASYLVRARWKAGKATLPVLLLEGRAIGDSTRIIEALEAYRAKPPLYPSNRQDRERAIRLEEFFDEELGHQLRAAAFLQPLLTDARWIASFASLGLPKGTRRVFEAIAPAFSRFYRMRQSINAKTSEIGHTKVTEALDRLQAEIQPSGYLVGKSFTVADLTAASLLGAVFAGSALQYPLPDPLPPSLRDFREALADHAAANWVVEMYRRHRGASAEVVA